MSPFRANQASTKTNSTKFIAIKITSAIETRSTVGRHYGQGTVSFVVWRQWQQRCDDTTTTPSRPHDRPTITKTKQRREHTTTTMWRRDIYSTTRHDTTQQCMIHHSWHDDETRRQTMPRCEDPATPRYTTMRRPATPRHMTRPLDEPKTRREDAMMQWCNHAMMIQWCNDAMMQWCNDAMMQWCNNATMQQCNNATMQQCNNATMQRCNNVTLQRCNDATMQQYNDTTPCYIWCDSTPHLTRSTALAPNTTNLTPKITQHRMHTAFTQKFAKCSAKHTLLSHPTTLCKDYCRRAPLPPTILPNCCFSKVLLYFLSVILF